MHHLYHILCPLTLGKLLIEMFMLESNFYYNDSYVKISWINERILVDVFKFLWVNHFNFPCDDFFLRKKEISFDQKRDASPKIRSQHIPLSKFS